MGVVSRADIRTGRWTTRLALAWRAACADSLGGPHGSVRAPGTNKTRNDRRRNKPSSQTSMTAVTGVAEDTPASTVKLALLEAEVNRGGALRVRELLRVGLEMWTCSTVAQFPEALETRGP